MKALRFIFILSMTVCVSVLVFYITGNPFDAALTYKSAVKTNEIKYSNRMKVSGIVYNMDTGLYEAEFNDGNGVVSEYIYNPADNSFTDRYMEDLLSVMKYTVRGEIIKKINGEGVYPEEVFVLLNCGTGIIGDECDYTLESVNVILDTTDAETFIEGVMKTLDALSAFSPENMTVMSHKYTVSFKEGNISNSREDIAARIKNINS